MEPSEARPRKPDTRITITIHDIALESQLRFKGLCLALKKPQYEVFNEMVDFYWKNLDLKVPERKRAVLSRKLLDEIQKVARIKHT